MAKKKAPKARNSEFAHLRSTGALRQRVIRNKKSYTRKTKHKEKYA
jgi:hypothetical protein